MTINLTASTKTLILQVSDRCVSISGAPRNYTLNKSIVVFSSKFRASVVYTTNQAFLPGNPALAFEHWLADRIAAVPDSLTLKQMSAALKGDLDRLWSVAPKWWRRKSETIVTIAAWDAKGGPPIVLQLHNCLDQHGLVIAQRDDFAIWAPGNPVGRLYIRGAVKMIARQDRRSAEKSLKLERPAAVQAKALLELARAVASKDPSVDANLMLVGLPLVDESFAQFFPEGTEPTVQFPTVVTLGDAGLIVSGLEMTTGDFEGPMPPRRRKRESL
jgi:hypothetical protein